MVRSMGPLHHHPTRPITAVTGPGATPAVATTRVSPVQARTAAPGKTKYTLLIFIHKGPK